MQSKCHLSLDQLQQNALWELLIFFMPLARQRDCHCILKTDFKSVVSENKGWLSTLNRYIEGGLSEEDTESSSDFPQG